MPGYYCHSCGKHHDELPFAYVTDAPDAWLAIPVNERASRGELSSDTCVIDDQFFFVRGNVEIPVIGQPTHFAWGVWVSLSRGNFLRFEKLWERAGREKEPPYFGWLNTALPGYPSTINLKTDVHTRPVGQRPIIELQSDDHPLAIEQRSGITIDRVREIAERLLHGRTA